MIDRINENIFNHEKIERHEMLGTALIAAGSI